MSTAPQSPTLHPELPPQLLHAHPVLPLPQAPAAPLSQDPGLQLSPGMHPHPGYSHPQPINIVVQNTNTMTQHAGAGAMVRVANRNKWVAAALALFLGGFGVHKFYLGQTGMGVVYLLFCWTFIPMLAALVETLLLVLASEREFDVRFNSALAR